VRSHFRLFLFVGLIASGLSATRAQAASCCGGGFASPSLIVGDDKATLSADLSYSNVATEVSSTGFWEDRNSPESLETLRLQGAHIFQDRFQIGASLPIVSRSRAGSTSTGFGDISLNLGFESLPEWDYSAWRPRGVSYLTLTAPTGRAVQESTDTLQLDARGRGFWAVGLGTTLTKNVGKFDLNGTIELHRSFAREVKTSSLEGEIRPGYGALLSLGAGYNIRETRIGANLAMNYEDAIATAGSIVSPGSVARVATAGLTVSQMINDVWTVSFGSDPLRRAREYESRTNCGSYGPTPLQSVTLIS
jgi:hypothetical protein